MGVLVGELVSSIWHAYVWPLYGRYSRWC